MRAGVIKSKHREEGWRSDVVQATAGRSGTDFLTTPLVFALKWPELDLEFNVVFARSARKSLAADICRATLPRVNQS